MRSFVHKIMINPHTKRAWGVKYEKKRKIRVVKARKEVILSAGGLMSAPILMHSGVGPRDHLQELGVKVYS
jgi:choline dehydrogenase-like flavoprotein